MNYPLPSRSEEDHWPMSHGLVEDVAEALSRHGYPPIGVDPAGARDYVRLRQHVWHFITDLECDVLDVPPAAAPGETDRADDELADLLEDHEQMLAQHGRDLDEIERLRAQLEDAYVAIRAFVEPGSEQVYEPVVTRPDGATNYVETIRAAIVAELARTCPDWKIAETPTLLDSYALLALTVGERVTREHVHDAWALWSNGLGPSHRYLVPFGELSPEVQAQDEVGRAAIAAVAAARGGVS